MGVLAEIPMEQAIARPLKVLVPLIKEELEKGDAAGVEHYRVAGEMLLEAKSQLTHGEFGQWVKCHFRLSLQHVRRYMQLAENTAGQKEGVPSFSSLSDFIRKNSNPNYNLPHTVRPKTWHGPVQLVVNQLDVERLTQERMAREQEKRLFREIGLRLIDIGYKVLAAKLHPDHGGSAEGMARLNRVRLQLKQAL